MSPYEESREYRSGWTALHERSHLDRLRWRLPSWVPGSLPRMRPVGPPEDGWPAHPLRGEPDGTVADWWLPAVGWDRQGVGAFVPPGFDAYAVVLHPFNVSDPDAPDGWRHASWAEVADAWATTRRDVLGEQPWMVEVPGSDGNARASVPGAPGGPSEQLERDTAAALLPHLTTATTTPDDVFVARWIGHGGELLRQRFSPCAVLPTEQRGHALLRGPLAGVLVGVGPVAWSADHDAVSGIWWPADRAWFVHTEVDGCTTEVAGSRVLVDALLEDEALEVVEVTHTTDERDHL